LKFFSGRSSDTYTKLDVSLDVFSLFIFVRKQENYRRNATYRSRRNRLNTNLSPNLLTVSVFRNLPVMCSYEWEFRGRRKRSTKRPAADRMRKPFTNTRRMCDDDDTKVGHTRKDDRFRGHRRRSINTAGASAYSS